MWLVQIIDINSLIHHHTIDWKKLLITDLELNFEKEKKKKSILLFTSIRFLADLYSFKLLFIFWNSHLACVVRDEIGALVDELIINTKKVIRATSREIDKWKR